MNNYTCLSLHYRNSNHSSPTSNYSPTSNPSTPTPETVSSVSAPLLPSTPSAEECPSPSISSNVEAPPPAKTLQAARKLPFGDSTDTFQHADEPVSSYNPTLMYPNMMPSNIKPVSMGPARTQSQMPTAPG